MKSKQQILERLELSLSESKDAVKNNLLVLTQALKKINTEELYNQSNGHKESALIEQIASALYELEILTQKAKKKGLI